MLKTRGGVPPAWLHFRVISVDELTDQVQN